MCFNTASVLIQRIINLSTDSVPAGFNTASVLIQPVPEVKSATCSSFQYSFCSYSTEAKDKIAAQRNSFNTASVLIQPSIFQYSL